MNATTHTHHHKHLIINDYDVKNNEKNINENIPIYIIIHNFDLNKTNKTTKKIVDVTTVVHPLTHTTSTQTFFHFSITISKKNSSHNL